jgi:hypothetical protein
VAAGGSSHSIESPPASTTPVSVWSDGTRSSVVFSMKNRPPVQLDTSMCDPDSSRGNEATRYDETDDEYASEIFVPFTGNSSHEDTTDCALAAAHRPTSSTTDDMEATIASTSRSCFSASALSISLSAKYAPAATVAINAMTAITENDTWPVRSCPSLEYAPDRSSMLFRAAVNSDPGLPRSRETLSTPATRSLHSPRPPTPRPPGRRLLYID